MNKDQKQKKIPKMKTRNCIAFLILLLTAGNSAFSQEALFGGPQIVSPEIRNDHSVLLRLKAPKADSVFVTGDILPPARIQTPMGEMDIPGKELMTKGEDGIWTYDTGVLDSELYNYFYLVDGVKTIDPGNPFLIRDVASITNIFILDGEKGDLYKVNDVPHGTVSRRWYDSPGLGMDRRLTIYTPPGYESSGEKYPVLYLLHGAGGDEEAWIALGRTAQILDNLIAQKKAKPMIVVMPNGNVSQDAAPGEGKDGFYTPQFMAPRTMNGMYEANFMDIVKFVEDKYRVRADKEHRAIAGLSMGGFHSLHISRYFPNTFDYVGLFSAAIMPRDDATGKVYSNFDETLKAQGENGYKLYWIGMGKTDFLYGANQEYRKKLDEMGMRYSYVESEGGHTWRNWRVYLTQFVPQLFQ
jgi:enterochelin esterase family protein